MKNQKKLFRSIGLVLTLGLAGLMSACGKSDSPNPPIGGVGIPGNYTGPIGQCGSGPYSFENSNCLTDFNTACTRVGGLVTSSRTCMIAVNNTVTSTSGILSPGDTSGPLAGAGILVRAGDLLTFSGIGTWGTAKVNYSSTQILKIFNFYWGSWSTVDCNKVNLNGIGDGKAGTNEGLPAGLIGAISSSNEAFMVGANLNNYSVHSTGVLHIGMNAPQSLEGLCGSYSGHLYVTTH